MSFPSIYDDDIVSEIVNKNKTKNKQYFTNVCFSIHRYYGFSALFRLDSDSNKLTKIKVTTKCA